MKIVITGAHGKVGTAITDHLGDSSEFDITYLDIRDHPDIDTAVADMTEYDQIRPVFEGQDAVIHLGYIRDSTTASSNRELAWSDAFVQNLKATYNVVAAAIDAGLQKCIYASSNHAVGLYEVEHKPEIYAPEFDLRVDHTGPVRPDSMYGLTKVFGEALGRFAAEYHGLQFYALRIFGVRTENEHPYCDAERGVREGKWERGSDEYWIEVARRMGMGTSRRDFANMIERCLLDETVTFDIFHVTSDNDSRWVDIDHARNTVGYAPRDNFNEWDGALPSEVPDRVTSNAPQWMRG